MLRRLELDSVIPTLYQAPRGLKVSRVEDANAPHTPKGVLRIRHPRLPVIKFWQWATEADL
ncbi:hypothetical protein CBM2633_P210003 [Cupriavidus taiwanensis]|uniref:Uncharacterized protein n=2 Tax=Cupriavidus TaxID=106589 RepID=A0A375CMV3_9BURK|nr:hypothetical protein CBM2588_P230003 [Cupriavidus taiwanensis]SOZ40479.1 hypothetical protein CBM2605_P210006 [Cupriavidus neocaledonicus]SOY74890.1 hypothetical protein CBM2585_P210003 [Cupriavidus taiwanensis]SOY74906.1 hypothetical protein CBM2592_P240009 [Cupriavidus taiwanensis]SOY75725.1 hypothetical protein CBM2589_P210003 [Cupriavidus taiwanensis]